MSIPFHTVLKAKIILPVIHTVLWVNLMVNLKLLNNNENHKTFAHNVNSISTLVKSARNVAMTFGPA